MTFFASSLTGAAIIAVPALDRRNVDRLTDVTMATLFASYPILFSAVMAFSEGIRHQTVDELLYRVDRSLGLDVFSWMHVVWGHHWLYVFLCTAYMTLPILIALGWVLERSTTMLRAMSIAPVLAGVIYYLVPAVGPIHAFTPDTPHTVLSMNALANLPRNCFPSMHLGWALLVALNARTRGWKMVAWIFTVLTAMATIGLGVHYYVDLLAAVPFCFAVQRLALCQFGKRPIHEGSLT